MADVLSQKQRSFNMSRIKSSSTGPELTLRKLLFQAGLRGYRLNYKLAGKPDIVFTRRKIAIFVDGCFWHKCPRDYKEPATNKVFWEHKIESNLIRDKEVNKILKRREWTVLRIWEHDLKKDPTACLGKILKIISDSAL